MSNKSQDVEFSGHFFVRNLSGSDIEKNGLWPAELVLGTAMPQDEAVEEYQLSCTMMSDGEIDYEIDRLIKQLEGARRSAKRMLKKHRKIEDAYMAKHGLLSGRR
jgi:hypothetical protein